MPPGPVGKICTEVSASRHQPETTGRKEMPPGPVGKICTEVSASRHQPETTGRKVDGIDASRGWTAGMHERNETPSAVTAGPPDKPCPARHGNVDRHTVGRYVHLYRPAASYETVH